MTKAAPERCGIGAREAVPSLPRDPSRARCTGLRCPARRGRAARSRRRPEAALDAFARPCCRETLRAALHRLGLSRKKAKKLLGRADPARKAFIARLRPVLATAQRDRHRLVYLDQARIHQAAELGHGGGLRGERCHLAS